MAGSDKRAEGVLARRLDAALPKLGYHCLHGVTPLREPGPHADHVVIGPGGAFVIQELDMTGEVRAGGDGRIWCGGQPLEDHLDEALTQAGAVGLVIGSHVTAITAIHGAEVKAPSVTRTVHLSDVAEVPALIGRRTTYRSASEVERLASRARGALAAADWISPNHDDKSNAGQSTRPSGGLIARLLRRRR